MGKGSGRPSPRKRQAALGKRATPPRPSRARQAPTPRKKPAQKPKKPSKSSRVSPEKLKPNRHRAKRPSQATLAKAARERYQREKKRSEAALKGWRTRHICHVKPLWDKRVELLGEITIFGGGLHGASKRDWFVLREMLENKDERWTEFREWGEEHGYSYSEIADMWFSPDM